MTAVSSGNQRARSMPSVVQPGGGSARQPPSTSRSVRTRASLVTSGSVLAGASAHPAGIGTEVWLSQSEATDGVSGGHPGQPLLLLFFAAVFPDREHGQRPLDRNERAEAGVTRLELHACQSVGRGSRAGTAIARATTGWPLSTRSSPTRLCVNPNTQPRSNECSLSDPNASNATW